MVAAPALVGLAAIVGRQVAIHPKAHDDWRVVPNLWGGIIARPGKLKSPVLAEALFPLHQRVDAARIRREERFAEHGTRLESLQAKEAALKKLLRQAHEGVKSKGKPEAHEGGLRIVRQDIREVEALLRERRYLVNDATVEKLGELMAQNPLGLLLERDELAGWLRTLERSDRKGDREFFLEAWNGLNSYTYDRIGRGTIQIPALCLSVIGGIQPAKLERYIHEALDGGYAADGLLQRFQLLVWPEESQEWQLVDRSPNFEARQTVSYIAAQLDEEDFPAILHFAPDAQQLFYEWLTALEEHLRSEELQATPAFESHLAKYRGLMPSLALLFHLIETVARGEAAGPVSLEAAKLSADWCEYLEMHARKIYTTEIASEIVAARALAEKIRQGALTDGMTVREAGRAEWSHLKSAEAVTQGMAVLTQHGWARIETTTGNGRPSRIIRLNPELQGGLP